MDGKGRAGSLSYLRIFATVAVIASHAWSTLTESADSFLLNQHEINYISILADLTKWAVPCFFMVTGALLLKKDKEISVKDCIWKYGKRILLALLIFSIPYALLMIYFDTRKISLGMIPESIIRVINGDSFGHLWYLYTLIGIYLFLPFIKLFVNNASKQVLKYTIILMFIFNFCFPFIDKIAGTKIAFELPVTTWPIFYLLLGHYVFNEDNAIKNAKLIPELITIVVILIVISVDLLTNSTFASMSYNTPLNVLCASSIFIIFGRIEKSSSDRLWYIDRLCFGAYLIHPLFIQLVYKYFRIIPTGRTYTAFWTIGFAAAFVIIGFAASWCISRIKPLKKYVL